MYNLRHIEWVEIDSPLDFFMKRQFKLLPAVIFCVCVDIKAMENEKTTTKLCLSNVKG